MNTPPVISALPAELWIGSSTDLAREVEHYLSKVWCVSKDTVPCFLCPSCKQVLKHHHPLLCWLSPAKGYTLADIEEVHGISAFKLEVDEKFFFIFEKAHTLSNACANKLLKLLEEPSPGYHFILLTSNREAVIPTIRSRCHLRFFESSSLAPARHQLLHHFDGEIKGVHPLEFEKDLAAQLPGEHETLELMSILLGFYCEKQMHGEHTLLTEKIIAHIKTSLALPAQSGSSSFFWKHFYLTFPRVSSKHP